MPETELTVTDPKAKFTSAVKLRFALWETMLGEINLDQEMKRQIIDILKKLCNEGLTAWDTLELAFSSTTKALDDIRETWKTHTSVPAIKSLFDNISQDISDLQTELLNPPAWTFLLFMLR